MVCLRPRPIVRLLAFAVFLVMAGSSPAGADPAGPTDYQTRIARVDPPSTAFVASIVGGDSFLLLEQREPVTIEVPGYNNEPYLRYLPDGTVERNRRSPTTYLNNDRYGDATNSSLPPEASADADPEWEVVAADGVYAWHDHRAHWMLAEPPLGLERGAQILDGRIPITVDGSPTQLEVVSFWLPSPSPGAAIGGALLAAVVGLTVWRERGWLPLALLMASLVALLVGVAQFASLPAVTEPSPVPWILPLIGALGAAGAAMTVRRPATALPLLLGGSVALMVFAVVRIESVTKAVLPSDLPFWVDRFGTVFALGVGTSIVVTSAVELSRLVAPGSSGVEPGALPAP